MTDDRIKAIVNGEEVELEAVSEEELERLAMESAEPEGGSPGVTDEEGWLDVLADSSSIGVRKSAKKLIDLRAASALLAKAGVPHRIAPSKESLLGIHTLQVKEPDLDRALEVLESAQSVG